jgi:cell division protein FtsL
VLCGALVLCSLLMVVAASAYLTQGQVRLTRMQQQLTSELGHHRDLEARVAQLADPSNVVSQAQRHGLTAPSHVTDLPQVTVSPPPAASTAPTRGNASVQPTAGR